MTENTKQRTSKMSDENYREDRKMLIEAEADQSRLFDRGILSLAAGALGLSLYFFRDIPTPTHIGFILCSWCLFGLSLFVTMTSFLISQKAHREQRRILTSRQKAQNSQASPGQHWSARVTGALNWVSLGLFGSGIIFLVLFTSNNINP
jgi:hypothetical protein